jgi:hypothetical protein
MCTATVNDRGSRHAWISPSEEDCDAQRSEFLVESAARSSHFARDVTPLDKLYTKLCRELAQSEHSAIVHTRREARRLGDVPPAHALVELGAHAASLRPRLSVLMSTRQPLGVVLARIIGELFSTVRDLVFDRLIDLERSYRGRLLGFHHGIAVARLLRDVAARLGDQHMVGYCEDMLRERVPLLEAAEREVTWFAQRSTKAIRSGLSAALEP